MFVVISHDCDLAADCDKEPFVEVVRVRRLKDDEEPTQLFGKNPRLLQMEVELDGEKCILEFVASNKATFSKYPLFQRQLQGTTILLPGQLQQLRVWLASRYRRHALPNELVDRLKPLFGKLEERAKRNADGVFATFVSFSPNMEIDDPAEIYDVSFAVVYDSENPVGEENAKSIVETIKKAFSKVKGVELGPIEAYNDMEFTLRDTRTMIELSYEHLSFRGEHNLFIEPA